MKYVNTIHIQVIWQDDKPATEGDIAMIANMMEATIKTDFRPFLAARKAYVKALVLGMPAKEGT